MMLYSGKPAYDIISEYNYDGTTDSYMSIYPLNFPLGKDSSFQWQGLKMNVHTEKNFSGITSEMIMPLTLYTGLEGDSLKEASARSFRIDSKIDVNPPMKSNTTMHLDNAYAIAPDHNIFNLDQTTISISDEKNKDLVNIDMKYNFNLLKIAEDNYGPLDLSVSIKNLSVKALEKIAESAPSSPSASATQINVNIPPEQILELLATRPNLDLNLKLGMPNGKIDLTASLQAGGKDLTSVDLKAISDTLSANINLKISQSIVYKYLLDYGIDQVHSKEKDFNATNKDPAAKNPYAFNEKDLQVLIDSWAITLLDVLKKNIIFTESKDGMSTHIVFDNKILTINEKPRQISEIMDLQKYLVVNIKTNDNNNNNKSGSSSNVAPIPGQNKITVIPSLKTNGGTQKVTNPKPGNNTPPAANQRGPNPNSGAGNGKRSGK